MDGNLAEQRKNGEYTYEDYLNWDEDERWELVDGWAYMMAPPGTKHQRASAALAAALFDYLKGKPCEVFHELGVRLFPKIPSRKIVQKDKVLIPDLSVVCDLEQLDDHVCNGPPTLVVEILSPSTASRDFTAKKDWYTEAGVTEYWIADPHSGEVHVYQLQKRENQRTTYGKDETLASPTFPGLEIPLSEIFSTNTNN